MWAYLSSPSKLFGDSSTGNAVTFTDAEAKSIAALKATLDWLDRRDVAQSVDVFKKSPDTSDQAVSLVEKIKTEATFDFLDGNEVGVVVCALKCYFKTMSPRLLSFPNSENPANEKEVKLDLHYRSKRERMDSILFYVQSLSPYKKEMLKLISFFLNRIGNNCAVNNTSPCCLGIIFSSLIFPESNVLEEIILSLVVSIALVEDPSFYFEPKKGPSTPLSPTPNRSPLSTPQSPSPIATPTSAHSTLTDSKSHVPTSNTTNSNLASTASSTTGTPISSPYRREARTTKAISTKAMEAKLREKISQFQAYGVDAVQMLTGNNFDSEKTYYSLMAITNQTERVRLIYEQFLSLPRVTVANLLCQYDGDIKKTSAHIFSILYEEKTAEQLQLISLIERFPDFEADIVEFIVKSSPSLVVAVEKLLTFKRDKRNAKLEKLLLNKTTRDMVELLIDQDPSGQQFLSEICTYFEPHEEHPRDPSRIANQVQSDSVTHNLVLQRAFLNLFEKNVRSRTDILPPKYEASIQLEKGFPQKKVDPSEAWRSSKEEVSGKSDISHLKATTIVSVEKPKSKVELVVPHKVDFGGAIEITYRFTNYHPSTSDWIAMYPKDATTYSNYQWVSGQRATFPAPYRSDFVYFKFFDRENRELCRSADVKIGPEFDILVSKGVTKPQSNGAEAKGETVIVLELRQSFGCYCPNLWVAMYSQGAAIDQYQAYRNGMDYRTQKYIFLCPKGDWTFKIFPQTAPLPVASFFINMGGREQMELLLSGFTATLYYSVKSYDVSYSANATWIGLYRQGETNLGQWIRFKPIATNEGIFQFDLEHDWTFDVLEARLFHSTRTLATSNTVVRNEVAEESKCEVKEEQGATEKTTESQEPPQSPDTNGPVFDGSAVGESKVTDESSSLTSGAVVLSKASPLKGSEGREKGGLASRIEVSPDEVRSRIELIVSIVERKSLSSSLNSSTSQLPQSSPTPVKPTLAPTTATNGAPIVRTANPLNSSPGKADLAPKVCCSPNATVKSPLVVTPDVQPTVAVVDSSPRETNDTAENVVTEILLS